jgi:hypothetical protein
MAVGITFLFIEVVKKIILPYPVSPNRDTSSAIKAMDEVLIKMKKIPDGLTFCSGTAIRFSFWHSIFLPNMTFGSI